MVETLLEMLANEKDVRVLATLATAHGMFRDHRYLPFQTSLVCLFNVDRLREGLLKFLTSQKEGDRPLPYRAQWSAFQVL